MPPQARTTKEMILDAAFFLVREEGIGALNVRNVARRLGCSTQPIMYNFETVDQLRDEVYRMADGFHTRAIMPGECSSQNPLLELGLNYIRFGAEEPNLFRFLFQSNQFENMSLAGLMDDPALVEMLQMVELEAGCTSEQAREAFLSLFVSAHGIASLLANNVMEFDEPECTRLLTSVFACAVGERR